MFKISKEMNHKNVPKKMKKKLNYIKLLSHNKQRNKECEA